MSTQRTVVRAHRPLRELTDEEIATLSLLGDHARLLAEGLRAPLRALALLAAEEQGERELKRAFMASTRKPLPS